MFELVPLSFELPLLVLELALLVLELAVLVPFEFLRLGLFILSPSALVMALFGSICACQVG
ncbi:hypothetical protein K432DRAFT_386336 [Lepidopterella palustris CBS 459.81]|uniref:Uncharacterized protein n=1 Tax=Lepidopterella palustris CBS 459.81 TaxID=1314670 RepID=A0A8E2JAB5_9PEZI|nr:hypothetical protein K432DRAFT_386336 [Lepidopterella palustris CBS 459.81]